MRRLRRILPKGTAIVVCLWSEGEAPASLKAVLETAEPDAYATRLPEAVELCISFAKGEHAKNDEMPSVDPHAILSPATARAVATPAALSPKSEIAPLAPLTEAAQPKNSKKRQATPRKPQTASA